MSKYLMMLLAVGVSGVAISAELATQGDASAKPQMKCSSTSNSSTKMATDW